jgi:hypothetical protein
MLASTLLQGHPINSRRTVFPVTGERTQNRKRTGGEVPSQSLSEVYKGAE